MSVVSDIYELKETLVLWLYTNRPTEEFREKLLDDITQKVPKRLKKSSGIEDLKRTIGDLPLEQLTPDLINQEINNLLNMFPVTHIYS